MYNKYCFPMGITDLTIDHESDEKYVSFKLSSEKAHC